jgi:hypothetical protein
MVAAVKRETLPKATCAREYADPWLLCPKA